MILNLFKDLRIDDPCSFYEQAPMLELPVTNGV